MGGYRDQILDLLKEKAEKTGGHCGTQIPDITNIIGVGFDEIRDDLNDIYEEGLIDVRDGIRGRLLFIK